MMNMSRIKPSISGTITGDAITAKWLAGRGVNRTANDNGAKPKGDPWVPLIARLQPISPALAALAWKRRAQGWTVGRFCEEFLRCIGEEV